MKAISLLQPWAELCVIGAKQFETRSWKTKHRGDLLIHASAGKQGIKLIDKEDPYGALATELLKLDMDKHDYLFGAIIGKVTLTNIYHSGEMETPNIFTAHRNLSEQEKAFGDYTTGRYVWELIFPVKFKTAIPYKGGLSIWDFPDEYYQKLQEEGVL